VFDFALGPALAGLRGRQQPPSSTCTTTPDPDALAAAFGLKRVVENALPIKATLALGGIVGRAENRAMVETLGIPLFATEALNPGRLRRPGHRR